MRLTQIKLSGFKSFVDPTSIGTPGQLVGIVGPNGCGKSNVIDAVRWVLGESKASALRGESMQDVIFNGAGDRKPIGRASVELFFDNSEGRIGGQWGQYAELSIKRMLTRDGDSTYYINNIPVRRRDIHDLFLGTGLGPRAYAIIEQGMISRVIDAKPEELRVFLEEAAGVSKYKERRRETEGRIADTRENLSRVDDIRQELGNQLAKLDEQAKVAAQYHELEGRHRHAQHLLWHAKAQEAVRARERCTSEIAALGVGLEALQADVRHAEARLVRLRDEHFSAGDALHERQGAFYAANAEVTRLEQQLAFARESETRLSEQVAQLTEAIASLGGQQTALDAEQAAAEDALREALAARERTMADEAQAQAGLPGREAAVAETSRVLNELQQQIALTEQHVRVGEARRDSAAQALARIVEQRARLASELDALALPATDPVQAVEQQLAEENAELAGRQKLQQELQAAVRALQERHRGAGDEWQRDSKQLADLAARADALSALQARIGHGKDIDGWLEARGLTHARRLWQVVDIEPGWEDALEAVLRERLNALELARLDEALAWVAGTTPPGRLAVYTHAAPQDPVHATDARPAAVPGNDALVAKVRATDARVNAALADGLHGVRCQPDLAAALAARTALAPGETFITPEGHRISAHGIAFFAPDSELHGVLARQRELTELAGRIDTATIAAGTARAMLETVERDLADRQATWHQESLALASQQRRCHDLEIELVQLRQSAEAAARRRSQLAQESDDLATQHAQGTAEHAAIAADIADRQSQLHDQMDKREAARHARNETEVALARSREQLRLAERAAQEAQFAERSCRDRLADIARRRESLTAQAAQQEVLLAQLTSERQSVDWTPVEEALQRQLAARGEAEQALAGARNRQEALTAELRAGDEARLVAEQKLDPARAKIQEMQLKEQAAAIAEQQFAEQLAEAKADIAALPEALKAWGSARTLPGEIERLAGAIAELGAVNLAALDELTQASERKSYLDRQAADLTEAMTTLESAIRQIDRESRELLQQTFDIVSTNFAKLFPTLFGGGQAKLLLTGEEILDSGVQVIAHPPGKRNTTIHQLSGGEKALTAIALVFALFQLNPAPFCLLDEVDAPLDESNTHRFCEMVREMSAESQFLFISHNKITMEMATQLVGITMPDLGVSRVVAVDIAEALELASEPQLAT
ncbi:MAG TPA: chromosome segregation protein SMC [Casimicrobiaceae bacterium]|nr:chromosome segregation protein SMC [Casimicrobiaceae bacterium]